VHEIGPVFETAFVALFQNFARQGRSNALDGIKFGRVGFVDIDSGKAGQRKQQGCEG
jgi:hypothetical protein